MRRLPEEPYPFFKELKRGKVGGGPYPGVSIFEAANRILSDLVVLFSSEQLISRPLPGLPSIQLSEIEIALGVKAGPDLRSRLPDGGLVIGECFNVAPSFFKNKLSSAIRKLKAEVKAVHRVLAFNADAVDDPDAWLEKSSEEWSYVLIRVDERLDQTRDSPSGRVISSSREHA